MFLDRSGWLRLVLGDFDTVGIVRCVQKNGAQVEVSSGGATAKMKYPTSV